MEISFKYLLNIARASNLFQIFILYFSYFFTSNTDFLIFFIGFFFNINFNIFLKYYVFLQFFGKQNIPILGRGIRPTGAKNCCSFKPCKPLYPKYPDTYGMPSRHSQSIAFFSTLCILYLLTNMNNKNIFINIFGCFIFICFILFIMYTRILFKCHTLNQTIIGSLIGIILAILLFKYKDKIKKKLKKYKNYELYLFVISTLLLCYYIIVLL